MKIGIKRLLRGVHRFAGETTIHGVVEFTRFGAVGKLMWVAIFFGSIFFFVHQTYELTVKFSAQELMTTVSAVPAVFPDFALYFDLYYNLDDPDHLANLTNYDLSILEMLVATSKSEDYYDYQEKFLNYTLDDNIFKIEQDHITQIVRNAFAPYGNPIHVASFFQSLFPIQLKVGKAGIVAVIQPLKGATSAYGFLAHVRCSGYFKLLIGTNAFRFDYHDVGEYFFCESPSMYRVTLTPQEHRMDSHYCNERLTVESRACENYCISQNIDPNGCYPYVGELINTTSLMWCHDHLQRNRTVKFERCLKKCASLESMKLCSEVRSLTTISSENLDHNSPPLLQIRLSETTTMSRFTSTRAISEAQYASSIGGTLGLCFGASWLSIAHMVSFCCKPCWNKWKGVGHKIIHI